MKERASWPMKAWEVRAILDGRKTQTRRVVKLTDSGRVKEPGSPRNWHLDDPEAVMACPYGVPGDRLWVRETWCPGSATPLGIGLLPCIGPAHLGDKIAYRATDDYGGDDPPWRPSIHMPRWASRITLEIVSVRVERVQEISKEDARAEGVRVWEEWQSRDLPAVLNMHDPRDAYAQLWDSINAKRAPWESNPWVWVIEFRRAGE